MSTLVLCEGTRISYFFSCAGFVCQIMVAHIPVCARVGVRRCSVAFSLHLPSRISVDDDFWVIVSEVPCCSRLNPLGSHGCQEIEDLHQSDA